MQMVVKQINYEVCSLQRGFVRRFALAFIPLAPALEGKRTGRVLRELWINPETRLFVLMAYSIAL